MTQTSIAILIPAYNEQVYIRSAIQSVQTQECDVQITIIVVDDGSSDATAEIVADIAKTDSRVTLIKQKNQGVVTARNTLLDAVPENVEYVSFLDADDAYPAGRIARDIAFFISDPTLDIIYGQLCLVSSDLQDLETAQTGTESRLRGISVTTGTYRRALLERIGHFDPDFQQGEDLDYLLRLFETGPNKKLLDEISVYYRKHAGNATEDKGAMRRGVMQAMLRHAKRRKADPTLAGFDGIFEMQKINALDRIQSTALPAYSVVIPVYNGSAYIAESIKSVFAQTVPPKEVIIVDDGSTDDLAAVLSEFAGKITVIRQENTGPGGATTNGINNTTCEYIATLDADDLWQPDKMQRQLKHMLANPKCDGIFSKMKSFASDDSSLTVDDARSGWSRSTLVIKKTEFDRIGPIVDMEKNMGEMIDWIARAREKNVEFIMLDSFLAKRRVHKNSLTARRNNSLQDKAGYMQAAIRAMQRRKENQ